MHYAYERGSLKGFDDIKNHDILLEVKRDNGKPQSVEYITRTPLQKWMRLGDSHVAFVYDSCGCGVQYASLIEDDIPLELNPAKEMRTVMMTPAVKELPVEIHEDAHACSLRLTRPCCIPSHTPAATVRKLTTAHSSR